MREFARHGADAHLRLLRDGEAAARCSLWWRNAPGLPEGASGVVGHYAAADAAAGGALLERACAELAARGCTTVIGPMDGCTWRRYRLVTDRAAPSAASPKPNHMDHPGPSTDGPANEEAPRIREPIRSIDRQCSTRES